MRTHYDKNDLGKSFAIAVATMLLAQLVVSLLFKNVDAIDDVSFWLAQALYQILIGSSAFIYAATSKTKVTVATGMNRVPKLSHVGWGCLAVTFLVAFMLPVNEWLMQLIVKLGFPEPSVDLPLQVVPMILVACVLPSFTEEIVFRGTVAKSVERIPNRLAGLAVSGGLFALFHLNPAQTLHQFVLGAFLALLVFRSGSVWTASLVHLFNNLLAVLLTFTLNDESVFCTYWYVFVPVGVTGFAASVYGYVKTTKSSWAPSESIKTERYSTIVLAVSVLICVALWIVNLVLK